MKRVWAVVLVAAAAVGWLYRAQAPRAAKPTAGATIIAFGDSLVAGRGATPGHDLASQLSARLGVSIVNAGRSGDTTSAALSRLDRDVLARDPRVVIVVLGGNDALRRVPRATTFENLGTIVTRIRDRGAAVVLAGIDAGMFTDGYDAAYEELAVEKSAGLVPDILDGLLGRSELMHDTIHPNDRGYAIMADRLAPVVRELLESD